MFFNSFLIITIPTLLLIITLRFILMKLIENFGLKIGQIFNIFIMILTGIIIYRYFPLTIKSIKDNDLMELLQV